MLSQHLPGGTVKDHEKPQDSRSPGKHLNPVPPVYEAGVLTTRPRRSVISMLFIWKSIKQRFWRGPALRYCKSRALRRYAKKDEKKFGRSGVISVGCLRTEIGVKTRKKKTAKINRQSEDIWGRTKWEKANNKMKWQIKQMYVVCVGVYVLSEFPENVY
jgi:hypothetical protein